MIKTLKWIYKLGYKHAESKYYHTLQHRVEAYERDEFYLREVMSEGDKLRNYDIKMALSSVIDGVFHPEVLVAPEQPQTRNRFES